MSEKTLKSCKIPQKSHYSDQLSDSSKITKDASSLPSATAGIRPLSIEQSNQKSLDNNNNFNNGPSLALFGSLLIPWNGTNLKPNEACYTACNIASDINRVK